MEVPTQALHLSNPRKPLVKLLVPWDGEGEGFETTSDSPKHNNQLSHHAVTIASTEAMDEKLLSTIPTWCTDLQKLGM